MDFPFLWKAYNFFSVDGNAFNPYKSPLETCYTFPKMLEIKKGLVTLADVVNLAFESVL